MKYYAVSDIHGFFTEAERALREKGFFDDPDGKLILCGDALDRGGEAQRTVELLLELHREGRLIYIRGNHEDLMEQMLQQIAAGDIYEVLGGRLSHHISNGTLDSALQLSGIHINDACRFPERFVNTVMHTPFYRRLLPTAVDWFETENFIFVHGYIPCTVTGAKHCEKYYYREDWRDADGDAWRRARWFNGMEFALKKRIREEGKTIVCGHWHASYGHKLVGKTSYDFGGDADFSPFCSEGIIAIDGCTAHSGRVNCVVFEGE